MSLRRLLIAGSALGLLFAGQAAAQERVLASPDGRLSIVFNQQADGTPVYSVRREGQTIIAPSRLTLDLDIGGELGRGMVVTGDDARQGRDTYDLIGKASRIDHAWREMSVELSEAPAAGRPTRRMQLVFRAYDDGVALRYIVPTDGGLETVGLKAENTQFAFPTDYTCWGLNLGRFNSAHEGEFDPIAASRIRDHNAYDAPLVCETAPGGPAFALAEADLRDYPALYLAGRGDGEAGVQAKLAPHPDAPTL
ncbi:MAG: glycoside hydrolase family 97 protein, partial [Caulobacteraceae bacterium]